MDILLDTHAAIWFFEDDKRLSKSAVDFIYNLDNMIYVSIVSPWELGIKLNTGKLTFDGGIDGFIDAIHKNEFVLLGINAEHVKKATNLPLIHRDPFDRMLIAQAAIEDMSIITVDENIMKYNINTIW